MVEMNGCILKRAVKKPATEVKQVVRTMQAGKVENLTEDRAGVDALVHDDGRRDHAHTCHTTDREVGTGQENQACDAEREEHTRRRLLQNVQNIVVGKELRVLHNRGHNAERDENHHNDNVETVL